ncbi:protein NRT1/ PTR FAMILY 3.1-like [Punica granatum]|uniref:Uncharacterized protein n=2 Tax=Punica granatum TaxID=22663 RepID=A0A2I0K057_PUNGR|nr:protein NRT1/ PTR FAMILY 3.1-like [Punica granatum]PKI61945.1 hypothetical protein CRG98_017671 [Punica granatum]
MESKHSPQGGRAQITDQDGADLGVRYPLNHGLCPAGYVRPPAGQDHGPATDRLLPNPAGLHDCVHHDRCSSPLPSTIGSLSPWLGSSLYLKGESHSSTGWASGFVEVKRKHAVAPHSLTSVPISTLPISTFWLVPQYALHGMAEAFISIGHLEFFRTMISIGNYTSTLLVTLVHEFTDWLPNDNLNKERLEYFYWLITFLQVINLIYYLLCAKFYTFKLI